MIFVFYCNTLDIFFVASCSLVGCYLSRSVNSNTCARINHNRLVLYILFVPPRVLKRVATNRTCLTGMRHLGLEICRDDFDSLQEEDMYHHNNGDGSMENSWMDGSMAGSAEGHFKTDEEGDENTATSTKRHGVKGHWGENFPICGSFLVLTAGDEWKKAQACG